MQQTPKVRTVTTEGTTHEASQPRSSRQATTTIPQVHPIFVAILSFLLFTLLLGHFLSPSSPESKLNARIPAATFTHLSSVQQQPLSTWADKRNFINRFFVKRAWGWTTGVLISAWLSHGLDQSFSGNGESARTRHLVKSWIRYGVATMGWILVTQWFLGSSLSERVLKLTGAQCTTSLGGESGQKRVALVSNGVATGDVVESTLCERRWGKSLPGIDLFAAATQRPFWSGGFDISGHTFLLSLSILLITSSAIPLLARKRKTLLDQIAITSHAALASLWWWMLFMTSIYFHGPGEKLMGMLFGMAVWWTSVYTAGS